VLLDFHQNGMGRTTASVYSVRPKPGATVSVPLRWEELTDDIDRRDFAMAVALQRIHDLGDIFAPVLEGGQTLDKAMATLGASTIA
jgi:bifunctional non-homologous end joining protein LigD